MHVEHRMNLGDADTSRRRSGNVWSGCPWNEIVAGIISGVTIFDDFNRAPYITTPTITSEATLGDGWKAFGSSGGTLIDTAGAEGGVRVFTETDDNQGVNMQWITLPFKIIRNTYGSFWFEARLKTSTITDLDSGIFVGLMASQTLSATVPIAAAGTLADNDFVGFHRLEADGDQFDAVYKAGGVTQVTVEADSFQIAADTWFKLGMRYDAKDYSFHWYGNNLELTSYTVPAAAGTDFPNDVFMSPCIAMLCGSNNDSILSLDWVRAAQSYEYPSY